MTRAHSRTRFQTQLAKQDESADETKSPENGMQYFEFETGGDLVSTRVTKLAVHVERVVTLVKQSL